MIGIKIRLQSQEAVITVINLIAVCVEQGLQGVLLCSCFHLQTTGHAAVAGGSLGLSWSQIVFFCCMIRNCNLSGLLWDLPCCICLCSECVDLTWI